MVELSFTEIVDGAHFFAHVAGDASVEVLQQRLADDTPPPTAPLPPPPTPTPYPHLYLQSLTQSLPA